MGREIIKAIQQQKRHIIIAGEKIFTAVGFGGIPELMIPPCL
jgi:hypothetical protein